MTDIGDGNDQPPPLLAARDRLAVHRVVEIARVLAVDRHERHIAQIDTATQVARLHAVRQAVRQREGLGRELVRHRELAHGDLDFHARIVDGAQHLDHAPDRLHVALRLLQDLDHDDLAGLCRQGRAGRHEDVVLDTLVLRHDDGHTAFVEQAADELVGAAFDDLDDLAFGTTAAVGAGHACQHAVAVQHLAHFVLGQHEVLARIVADQEAEAVAVALYLA